MLESIIIQSFNINKIQKSTHMKRSFTYLIILLVAFFGSANAQAPGTPDNTFNGTGTLVIDNGNMDLFTDVEVQPDGKIVAVGMSYDASWNAVAVVYRFNPDGWPDISFALGGSYMFSLDNEANIYACHIKDDGSILLVGSTTDYSSYRILMIQLNSMGFPDENFGEGGVVVQHIGPDMNSYEDHGLGITLQDDGKILVSGKSYNSDYRFVPVVVRFNANGSLDTSFGVNGVAGVPVTEVDNEFTRVCVQSDGKIIASGHISNGLSWFSLLIARFDENGILDPAFGTNGVVNMNLNNVDDEFFGMALTPDDEIVLCGFTTLQSDYSYHTLVMKFDATGQVVAGFGDNGAVVLGTEPMNVGDAMALQDDNKILVVGTSGEMTPMNNDWAMWRLHPDGSLDNTFGTEGKVTTEFFGNADEALGIALFENKIVVAGKARNTNNNHDLAVARYNNDTYVSVEETNALHDFKVSPNPVNAQGTVTISYNLKQAGIVTVEMIDVTGKTVSVLSSRFEQSGQRNSQCNMPSDISNGVYFVRINSAQGTYNMQKLLVY
jgi:uncharacterized delta-60 repeat protein